MFSRGNLLFLRDKAAQGPADPALTEQLAALRERFIAAMDDDLNTADAVGVLFELVRLVNTQVTEGSALGSVQAALDALVELTGVLGLLLKAPEDDGVDSEIEALVAERQQARKDKNWKRADEIRDLLKQKGVAVEDTPQGVKVKRL